MEESDLRSILLRRLHLLVADPAPVDPSKKAVFLVEAYALGFVVENPDGYSDRLLDSYAPLMAALAELRGGHVDHVPLYSEFPTRVPEQGAYLTKRLLGYVLNAARWDVPGAVTEGGYVVPEWLFELEHFGANPITQMQDLQLFLKSKFEQATRAKETPRKPTTLRFASSEQARAELRGWLKRCLCSKTSLPAEQRQDILAVLNALGAPDLTPAEVGFREHRALLSRFLWSAKRWERLAPFMETPTDLLRTFAALTETNISLDQPVKYPRMSKAERRFVLRSLEAMGPTELVEDQLLKYRGLWLKLERGLHSGEWQRQFPRAYEALRRLREGLCRPRFSALEQALARADGAAIAEELERLPGGVTVRRFAHAMAVVGEGEREALLERLRPRLEKASLKDLLMLSAVLKRDGWAVRTLVLTKRGATQVIPRQPGRLSWHARSRLTAELEGRILARIRTEHGADSWAGKKVYIDPAAEQLVIPLSLRSASEGLMTLGRGSRVPLGLADTVRLYVYWKQRGQRTDLDLSTITFAEDGSCTGFVDWTRLSGSGMVHSGDLQSAPFGAAEFIDARIDEVREKSGRYLAAGVFRFSGDSFSEMEVFTGWMERDQPNADYKTFDPATVSQKADLKSTASYAIPFLIDLQERQVLWLDLAVWSLDRSNQVANSYRRLEQLVGAGGEMARWAPTLAGLARHHVEARGGELTAAREQATITFALDRGADYHPGDWSRVLSELL